MAVGDELVFALLELLDQIGIARGRHGVHRHAGAHLIAVEHVEHAEDAGAVAVLALCPGAVVGHEAAELADQPRIAMALLVSQQLPVFEMQQHEPADARIARPGELGPLREGHVVVPGIVHPGLEWRRILGNGRGHVTPPSGDAAGRVLVRWRRTSPKSPRLWRPRHPCACGYSPAPGRDALAGAALP